jgi:hypothetical protein
MITNASGLIRWSGFAAVVAGVIFVATQPVHPPDVLSSVSTTQWQVVHIFSTAMCFLALLGITGLYARQMRESGSLGLAGYLVFSLFWFLQAPYVFAEAFILPHLTTVTPDFVLGWLAMAGGPPGGMDLGALTGVYQALGILYILGGLLFGVATFRARILSRWAAGLLIIAPFVAPTAALLPGELHRIAAVPMGIALAWLGYSLWSERHGFSTSPLPGTATAQLRPAEVK